MQETLDETKHDVAEDLLAGLEWGFSLSFSEAEREAFRKARAVEWQSGDATWQLALVKSYRQALAATPPRPLFSDEPRTVPDKEMLREQLVKEAQRLLTAPLYRNLTQYALFPNAHIEDAKWLQSLLKRSGTNKRFPLSKAGRVSYERENVVVAKKEEPSLFGGLTGNSTTTVTLTTPYLVKGIEVCNSELGLALSRAEREELAKRWITHWQRRKEDNRSDIHPKTALDYIQAQVFGIETQPLEEFAKKGDADAVWLLKKKGESWLWRPVFPGTPAVSLFALRNYAAYRLCQINQVAGKEIFAVTPRTKAVLMETIRGQWSTLPAAKKTAIANGVELFREHQNLWQYQLPLLQDYQRHLWGAEVVQSIPELKPVVEARARAFDALTKKDSQWRAKAEMRQSQMMNELIRSKMSFNQAQLNMAKDALDYLVKSHHVNMMNIIETLKGPEGTRYDYSLKRITP